MTHITLVQQSRILSTTPTACAAVILAATMGVTGCSREHNSPTGSPRTGQAVPVATAVAERKDVPLQLRAIGTVRPYASVSVKSRVDGQIARVGFAQGGEVKQGDLILQIDDRPFAAARDQAAAILERDRVSLQNAEIDMRRTDDLAGSKAVPASLVDANRAKVATLKATIQADQAALELARLQLSFCSIYAPITGRVGMRLVDEGAMVRNNDTVLAVINQLRPVFVDFAVPEQSLPAIRRAAAGVRLPVEMSVSGPDASLLRGTLDVVNNEVDTATGTVMLRAVFSNDNEELWPGQFVNVVLKVGELGGATVVPSQAVQVSQNGEFVFVVNPDQTVSKRTVALGPQWHAYIVIDNGVTAGETVVTDGHMRLAPGAKVSATAPTPSPESAVADTPRAVSTGSTGGKSSPGQADTVTSPPQNSVGAANPSAMHSSPVRAQ